MRSLRPVAAALGFALLAPAAVVATTGMAYAQQGQPAAGEAIKQIALTDKQIDSALAAKKEIDPILAKLPEDAKPDPKVTAQLNAIAKKHQFADYAEFDVVSENIGLIMDGIDPETKKYVGAEVMLKKQIAEVQADTKMSAKDKKEALDGLNDALKNVAAVQFQANIDLIVKSYDKIAAAMPQQ